MRKEYSCTKVQLASGTQSVQVPHEYGIFVRFGNVELSYDEILSMAEGLLWIADESEQAEEEISSQIQAAAKG